MEKKSTNKKEKELTKQKIKKKNNKKKKGFTLIELLAVIVILGLLLAIAIPSITKYITQSRRKTVVSSIDGYVSSVVNAVNDQDYSFTKANTIYAVPIECITLEKGGTNPFGEWHQANNDYWAYVLVQYDSTNFSYNYGFTFKDSAGYGMYPTVQSEINPKSSDQIKTGLELTKPKSGKATDVAVEDNWNGFKVDETTNLVVLEAESEGTPGDGQTTCTLCQKGNNYEQVEKEKEAAKPNLLSTRIRDNNKLITAIPTLTTSSNNTSDANGLYASTDTNSGKPTYYFRGTVNNYIEFADLTWKIIRINEDGTVRLILNDIVRIGGYNANDKTYEKMYYSNNSDAKAKVDDWYQTNIFDKGYDSYVATGVFCEQAKVSYFSNDTSGNATMVGYSNYTPTFKCVEDGNGYGILNSKVGLINIDEAIYAGGYFDKINTSYYLYKENYGIWTMSPAGVKTSGANGWLINSPGNITDSFFSNMNYSLRPVINLNTAALATGTGTEDDPYVVQTN